MYYNFHTHTFRCHHASGTPEEYVLQAIDNNFKVLGFSEHIPLLLPDGQQSRYRLYVEDVQDYVNEINSLKVKYKGKIDIKLGFEIEYYPNYFDEMLKNAKAWGAEYLILGQHFLDIEYPIYQTFYVYNKTDDLELFNSYVNLVIKGMTTGKITYVAHPDIFNYVGDKQTYQNLIRPICVESKRLNVPLEINMLGIRQNRIYPNEWFWEVAGQENSPVVFGSDAHEATHVFNNKTLGIAKEIVKKFKLNYIGKPKIIELR